MVIVIVRKVLVFMALVFAVAASSNAQPVSLTLEEREHLDSLVYAVAFDELRTALEQKEERIRSLQVSAETREVYRQEMQDYNRTLQMAASILAQESSYIQEYVAQRMEQQDQHEAVRVGDKAAKLYDDFKRSAEQRAYTEAIKYFAASRFFRTVYLRGLEQRLTAYYEEARVAYEADAYKQAKLVLDSASVHFDNPLHQPIIAKLQALNMNVERLLQKERRRELDWGRQVLPSFKAGLSVGGQLVVRGPAGPATLELHDPLYDEVISVDREFQRSLHHAYDLEAYAFLGEKWALGAGFSYINYHYTNGADNGVFSFDLDMKSKVAYAFTRYMLRPEIGLRPYVMAGGGLVQIDKGKGRAGVYGKAGEYYPSRIYEVDINGKESTGAQARTGLGIEYVSCETCMFVVGGEVDVIRNFIDSDFLSAWQSVFTLRVGLYL